MGLQFFSPTFIPISETERVPMSRVCKITTDTVNGKVIYTILVEWFDNTGRNFIVQADSKAGQAIAALDQPLTLLSSLSSAQALEVAFIK